MVDAGCGGGVVGGVDDDGDDWDGDLAAGPGIGRSFHVTWGKGGAPAPNPKCPIG